MRIIGAGLVLALAACGGASASEKGAKSPDKAETPSIGALAAANGGLASLGGAGNREEGTGTEVAFAGPLRAETISKKSPPKLDGTLKEWHARTPAKETLSGKTDGVELDVAVQADDATLWIAAEVVDPKLARTPGFKDVDDHVTVTLAFPSGRGTLAAYEIGLWPGQPGSFAGAVKWIGGPNAGQIVTGARLVEDDTKGGVTIEATVPWSAFPKAVHVGMRAAFAYHDGDGASTLGVLATGGGSVAKPNELSALPTAAEQAVIDGLLTQRGLAGTPPKIDLFVDIAGDDRKERVSIFGPFFTICGPGYRRGHQFFWREVAGEIVSIETSPFADRAKESLVVHRRVKAGGALHEVLEVWAVPEGKDEPHTLFAHEIAISSLDGARRVSNAVQVGAKEITITTEPPTGWDASSFREPLAAEGEPLLLPWGSVRSQTFRLEGTKLVKSEVSQAATTTASTTPARAADPQPRELPASPPSRMPEMGTQAVLDAYLRDANLPAGTKPRIDLEADVDGTAQRERIAVFGRDIVVLGQDFKNGKGYARISLTQFADAGDVSGVVTQDLTGDGRAELVVRGVRHIKTAQGQNVDVDALFVYQVKSGNIGRVFAIETGREMSGKRVQGAVQFVPARGGKGFDIDVRPGVAKGWTKESYPWPQDRAGGQIEPLLLPWSGTDGVRYTWNGTQFAAP